VSEGFINCLIIYSALVAFLCPQLPSHAPPSAADAAIIVTGNDFSTLFAPLIRDGRMDKFFWCAFLGCGRGGGGRLRRAVPGRRAESTLYKS